MRAINREWLAAMSARAGPARRLVRIATANGVREFVSGDRPLFGAPASVVYVSPRGSSIDPWTRALSISERHVRMRLDVPVRDMLATEHVAGCRIEVLIGSADLPRSRWVREWFGQVIDAPGEGNAVTIRCGDTGSMLRSTDIRGSWVAQHPLDVVSDILSRGEAPPELYSSSSFDRRLLTGQSHWSLSRAGIDGVNVDPELNTSSMNAWTAIQEQIGMLGGGLRFDANQALEYVPYDRRRSAVRHFTADQIANFRVREIAGNRCDEMVFEFCKSAGAEPARYTVRVPGAAAEHRWEGYGERAVSKTIQLPWVQGRADFDVDISATAPGGLSNLTIYEAERNGLCGFRYATYGAAQDAADGVSADRRAYLLVDSEIMEVLSINSVSGRSFRSGTLGVPGVAPVFYPLYLQADITVHRGALGTTIAAHPYLDNVIHDITIPVWMARDRARFAHGAAVVEFDVPLSELEVDLLDFASFDRPSLVFRGCNGADRTHVWEVIDQSVDADADAPCIHLVLLYAYNDKPTGEPVDNEVLEVVPALPSRTRLTGLSADEVNTRLVVDGMLPTIDTGRVIDIPVGNVDGTANRERNRSSRSTELAATRDHYLRYNVRSRALEIVDVAVGAAEPARRRGSVPIARVRTDATSIVSITDMRPTRPLDGANLVDASVPSGRMVYPLDTEVSQMLGTQIGTSRAARRAGNVETTNATTTTVLSIPLASKTAGLLRVEIGASRFATDDSGAWRITARVRHNGTAASVQASTAELTSTSDAAWAVSVTASGDNILVRVTGAASQTVRWTAAADLVVADAN